MRGRGTANKEAVGTPVRPQQEQRAVRQGHIPVFASFPAAHMELEARTIDLRHVEGNAFLHA
jgi:hypothetical protein